MSDGLYRRGGVWWLRCDPVTGGRRSTRCKAKPAAVAFRGERERLAADPGYAASHSATVGKWAAELVVMKTATRSAGTADMYRTKAGHVRRLFGDGCRMVDVTPSAVDRFVAARRAESAIDNTIGKELLAIEQMCRLAKRSGEFAGDIDSLRPVGFTSGYEPRKQTLTFEQVRQLFAVMPPARVAAVALAVAVGARRSEVQRIRREDIDLDAWTVRIAGTKTDGSDRTIPIPLPAHRILLQLAAESGQLPVSWPSMSTGVPRYCAKAGLPRATPNDLRRSFGTWGIEAGFTREDVAKQLGHASTAMVFRVYGRESAEARGAKMRRDIGEAPETHRTDASRCEPCRGRPASESSCFSGVSDGDRTRGNRSHNPVTGTSQPAGTTHLSESVYRGVSPDTTLYVTAGTDPSQRRRLGQLAAVGFRAQAAAWFGRAA